MVMSVPGVEVNVRRAGAALHPDVAFGCVGAESGDAAAAFGGAARAARTAQGCVGAGLRCAERGARGGACALPGSGQADRPELPE